MRLVPYYRVKYNGVFYEAGEGFSINDEDVEEMGQHGVLYENKPRAASAATASETKKPGRPRKAVTAHDEGQPVKTETQDAGN